MKKLIAAIMLFVILAGTFLFVGNVSAVQKNFTSTISPSTAYTSFSSQFTITITDSSSNPSGNKLGSASITIPPSFGSISNLNINPPAGKNWNPSIVSGQIKVTASTSSDCISPGQSIKVIFEVTPTAAGNYAWNTTAYTNPGWSGDLFSLSGPQPTVTVKQAVLVTFKYHVSDITSTSNPSVSITQFGKTISVSATKVGVSAWADVNSKYSYANPSDGSTSSERWVATVTPAGTVSTTTTVDPLYNHQFSVSFGVNPSTRAGTTSPSGVNLWLNSGANSISAMAYFGYTFSSWTTTTQLITINANSTTTKADIQGSGTIVAHFLANSGSVDVPGGTSSIAVYPDPNVGLDFGLVGTGGVATANTNTTVPPPPPGVTFIGPLWNITTTADFSGNVTVGIVVDLGTSGTDPKSLRLWQADFPLGDVNFDGIVDSNDTTIINKFYGTYAGGPNWNPLYDLDNNGVVNSKDVNICTHNYGETATWTMLTPLPPEQIPGTTLWVIYGSTDHFSGFGVH